VDQVANPQTKLKRSGSDWMLSALIGLSAIFTATIIVVPLLSGVLLSFYKINAFNVAAPPTFVGLANFVKVAASSAFQNAFANTVTFTFWSVTIQLAFALVIALALNTRFRLAPVVRTAVILPMLVPPVVIATIDRWITNESFGVIAAITVALGYEPIGWSTPGMAMWHVVGLGVWLWMPFMDAVHSRRTPVDPELALRGGPRRRRHAVAAILAHHAPSHLGSPGHCRSASVDLDVQQFRADLPDDGRRSDRHDGDAADPGLPTGFTAFDIGAGAATSTLSFLSLLVVVIVATRLLPINRT
jgi:ABC-type sugar transport system permease subunit